MANTTMMFRTSVNDFSNKESMVVLVEGETGKGGTVTVMDRETREALLFIRLPAEAAMNLSSAFALLASMEQGQMKDDLLRPDGLGD
jgi:hypothetical protein